MLDTYLRISFILSMAMAINGIVGLIPLLLLQHFIFKKTLDPTYFNNKYYSNYEISIFDSFPLFLIKTIGYIKAIVFPGTMRRKFKENILNPKERPVIYLLALLTIIILFISGLIIINIGVMSAVLYFTG